MKVDINGITAYFSDDCPFSEEEIIHKAAGRGLVPTKVDKYLHNENGPAIVWNNGKRYYLHGRSLTETEWRAEIMRKKLKQL